MKQLILMLSFTICLLSSCDYMRIGDTNQLINKNTDVMETNELMQSKKMRFISHNLTLESIITADLRVPVASFQSIYWINANSRSDMLFYTINNALGISATDMLTLTYAQYIDLIMRMSDSDFNTLIEAVITAGISFGPYLNLPSYMLYRYVHGTLGEPFTDDLATVAPPSEGIPGLSYFGSDQLVFSFQLVSFEITTSYLGEPYDYNMTETDFEQFGAGLRVLWRMRYSNPTLVSDALTVLLTIDYDPNPALFIKYLCPNLDLGNHKYLIKSKFIRDTKVYSPNNPSLQMKKGEFLQMNPHMTKAALSSQSFATVGCVGARGINFDYPFLYKLPAVDVTASATKASFQFVTFMSSFDDTGKEFLSSTPDSNNPINTSVRIFQILDHSYYFDDNPPYIMPRARIEIMVFKRKSNDPASIQFTNSYFDTYYNKFLPNPPIIGRELLIKDVISDPLSGFEVTTQVLGLYAGFYAHNLGYSFIETGLTPSTGDLWVFTDVVNGAVGEIPVIPIPIASVDSDYIN